MKKIGVWFVVLFIIIRGFNFIISLFESYKSKIK
jgi:hypothetical protein